MQWNTELDGFSEFTGLEEPDRFHIVNIGDVVRKIFEVLINSEAVAREVEERDLEASDTAIVSIQVEYCEGEVQSPHDCHVTSDERHENQTTDKSYQVGESFLRAVFGANISHVIRPRLMLHE